MYFSFSWGPFPQMSFDKPIIIQSSTLTLSQMTNFRLFQNRRVWRRQFQVWWKWWKVLKIGRKHCGIRRNWSLVWLFGKDLKNKCFSTFLKWQILILSQTSPGFYMSAVEVFWNTEGKGDIACYEQFLCFPQCFLPIWRTFCHFIKFNFVVCDPLQFGRV